MEELGKYGRMNFKMIIKNVLFTLFIMIMRDREGFYSGKREFTMLHDNIAKFVFF